MNCNERMFVQALDQCLKFKLIEYFPNKNKKERTIHTFEDEKRNYKHRCEDFWNLRQTCKYSPSHKKRETN